MQVPGAIASTEDGAFPWVPRYFRAHLTIEALTPHFYPQVYMNKVGSEEEPEDLSTLSYPSISEFDMAFGEDPIPQLYNNRFVYSWTGESTEHYTYYTIALYQNNWQLTDYKKSEYQVKVDIELIDKCEAVECDADELAQA